MPEPRLLRTLRRARNVAAGAIRRGLQRIGERGRRFREGRRVRAARRRRTAGR